MGDRAAARQFLAKGDGPAALRGARATQKKVAHGLAADDVACYPTRPSGMRSTSMGAMPHSGSASARAAIACYRRALEWSSSRRIQAPILHQNGLEAHALAASLTASTCLMRRWRIAATSRFRPSTLAASIMTLLEHTVTAVRIPYKAHEMFPDESARRVSALAFALCSIVVRQGVQGGFSRRVFPHRLRSSWHDPDPKV